MEHGIMQPQSLASKEKGYLPALTGIRAAGALMICLFHFQDTLYAAFPAMQQVQSVLKYGYFAVPFFFMLSGYLMCHHYRDGSVLHFDGYLSFLWKRIARLLPMNFLCQVLAIPIIYIFIHRYGYWGAPIPDWFSLGEWLKNALMLQTLGHPMVEYSWNQPA